MGIALAVLRGNCCDSLNGCVHNVPHAVVGCVGPGAPEADACKGDRHRVVVQVPVLPVNVLRHWVVEVLRDAWQLGARHNGIARHVVREHLQDALQRVRCKQLHQNLQRSSTSLCVCMTAMASRTSSSDSPCTRRARVSRDTVMSGSFPSYKRAERGVSGPGALLLLLLLLLLCVLCSSFKLSLWWFPSLSSLSSSSLSSMALSSLPLPSVCCSSCSVGVSWSGGTMLVGIRD